MLKIIIFNFILILLFCQNAHAQTDYMPLGAQLNGNVFALGFNGNFTTTSEKDTLCGGVPCRKIVIIEKSASTSNTYRSVYFSRQVKNSVFFFEPSSQSFELIYKTNMAVGDSISYSFYSGCCGLLSKATSFVDSIKFINSMQIMKCHLTCPSEGFGRPSYRLNYTLHDRFGTGYSFNPANFCTFGFYDGSRYFPTCYRDSQIFFTTDRFNASNCELTTTTPEINDFNISISPNPSQNYLDISANDNLSIRKCSLIDALGHIVQEREFNDVNQVHWGFDVMKNGLYLLRIQTSLGDLIVKKVIINH